MTSISPKPRGPEAAGRSPRGRATDGPSAAAGQAWWSSPSDALLARLGSAPAGLAPAEAAARLARVGPNRITTHRHAEALAVLLAQIRNPVVAILALSALVSAFVGELTDAAIILVILALGAVLGFWQEYAASRAAEDLLSRVERTARVRRGGQVVTVAAADIVPGDVFLLAAGDLVPADGVLLSSDSLFTVEAALTGEPFPVEKQPGPAPADAPVSGRPGAVWTGTSVRSGTGEALAVVTGPATLFGAIAGELERREGETAFTTGLRRFGLFLSEVMLAIVLVVYAANTWLGRPFFDSLMFSLALAVGLTPQMLPAILGVTLSAGARRLGADGVIVKRMSAIENLGEMDVLCTDKTGTITTGAVTLSRAVDAGGHDSADVLSLAVLNARLQQGLANVLDAALVAEGARLGMAVSPDSKIGEVPYDFLRRRLSVIVAGPDGAAQLVTKGAAEPVLALCETMSTAGGVTGLDPAARSACQRAIARWGHEGLRVLAVATRDLARRDGYSASDETALTLRGFLLFEDPPRADAGATLAALRARGVEVKIITGDSRFVAEHLARSVGIARPRAVTGAAIARMGADGLANLVARADVFAEIDPAGKERIVAALRKAGRVVGYIGDGINDATALRLADVGLSVDGAVDVAREAADMILTSPDLGSIVKGIDDGRRAYANTMKYIRITTAASFGNMVSMAVASVFLPFLPLLAKQILLNNLLSDLPMLALAGDRVDAAASARPHRWNPAALGRFMLTFGLISSLFDAATFWLLLGPFGADPATFRTGWFVESLLSELAFLIVIRAAGPVWASRPAMPLLLGTAGVALAAVALPYLPFAAELGFAALPAGLMLALLAVTLAYAALTETAKRLWFRPGDA